jgi:ArsR family transcriptional regulator
MAREPVAPHDVFRALADPRRWHVLRHIAEHGEVSASDLHLTLGMTQSLVSYHTRVLYVAGVIQVQKVGRNRLYSVREAGVLAVLAVLAGLNGYGTTP